MRELDVYTIANQYIATAFPNCAAAILAGSVVRGEATPTSDLDIVVFDEGVRSAYRESLVAFGWPIELFIHNFHSYQTFFQSDFERACPALQRMIVEGRVIKYDERLENVRQEATRMLEKGPNVWTEQQIQTQRYFVTDLLDDFIGCTDEGELLGIATSLFERVYEFYMRTNRQWLGSSKWMIRSLRRYHPQVAERMVHAFQHFWKTGEKQYVITFVDTVLQPYGGRLFDGFQLGKEDARCNTFKFE